MSGYFTHSDDNMSFDQLGLRVELLKAVKAKGYIAPTPIQSRAIPLFSPAGMFLPAPRPERGKQMHLCSLWLRS